MPASPRSSPAPAPFDPNAPEPVRRRRWLPWLGAAMLVVLLVLGLWPAALPVETAVARRAPLRVTIDEEGVTQVRHRYIVAAPVAGHLRRITLKPGAAVVAGETTLAVLEPAGADLLDARSRAQAEATVQAAESALARADAQHQAAVAALELARAEAERRRRLADNRMISQQELDQALAAETTAEQEERAARFTVEVARFELEQARAALVHAGPGAAGDDAIMIIPSPITGALLRVFQESARTVTPGLPLVEVGDPRDLEVRVEVLSRDAVVIQPGATVWLEQWGGPDPLEARVRLVEPAAFTKISALGVEEQRVNVLADLLSSPEDRGNLGDNYRVEARIVVWEQPDVLQVPSGAVFQQEGQWWCFVLDGRRARRRLVAIGRSNGVATQVLDGLETGETVIVYPGDRVADGARVREIAVGEE